MVGMKLNKTILIFLLFLISLSNVFATGQSSKLNYNESGNFDNLYQLGLASAFTSLLDPAVVNAGASLVSLSNGRKVPLISDLDGDGVAEIIILDENTIEIYQNKSLSLTASFTLDTSSIERFSNILTFDIDGDELREIILIAETEKELHILEYNRSILVNQTRFAGTNLSKYLFDAESQSLGETIIKCSSVDRCLIISTDTIIGKGEPSNFDVNVRAAFFNSSIESINKSFQIDIDLATAGRDMFCLPSIRHIAVADYDEDNGGLSAPNNQKEFIASSIFVSRVSDEEVNIYWVDILDNHSVVLENSITSTRIGNVVGQVDSSTNMECIGNGIANLGGTGFPVFPSLYVTSPMVYDADFTHAGLETIVGIGISFDDFKIVMFKKNGDELDDFPEVANSEGIMISNIFQADIFDDSSTDFCIMGFNGDPIGSVKDSLSVTCGSRTDPNGFGLLNVQTLEFRFDKTGLFNITQGYDTLGTLAHSIEADTSNSIDEVLSAYGIIELDRDSSLLSSCFLTGDCDMNIIFVQPKQSNNPRVISTDAYDKFGSEDLVILTDSNLFYLDDSLTNQPINEYCGESGSVTGSCTKYFINPCLNSIWKQNTTVQIRMIPSDPEGDLTSIRARIYNDAGVVTQDSGFVNVSSGTEFTISVNNATGENFKANVSGGGFTLTLNAIDIAENPIVTETLTRSFSVAESGVETFDCTTSAEDGVVDADADEDGVVEEGTLTVDATNNAITNSVNTIIALTGLGGTTLWLFGMMVMSVLIWFEGFNKQRSGNSTLGAIAIFNVLAIILGARLEIFSTGLIVTLVVMGVVIIGVFLGKFLVGRGAADD